MAISRRNEMPQQPVLFCENFDVWGIDFMGPLPISNGYSYILHVIDYMSRWVEARTTRTNDAKAVVDFLKSNFFCRVPNTARNVPIPDCVRESMSLADRDRTQSM
ncbi:hypothetical protein CR513_21488, partial [Mucuna pruriens]